MFADLPCSLSILLQQLDQRSRSPRYASVRRATGPSVLLQTMVGRVALEKQSDPPRQEGTASVGPNSLGTAPREPRRADMMTHRRQADQVRRLLSERPREVATNIQSSRRGDFRAYSSAIARKVNESHRGDGQARDAHARLRPSAAFTPSFAGVGVGRRFRLRRAPLRLPLRRRALPQSTAPATTSPKLEAELIGKRAIW